MTGPAKGFRTVLHVRPPRRKTGFLGESPPIDAELGKGRASSILAYLNTCFGVIKLRFQALSGMMIASISKAMLPNSRAFLQVQQ